MKDNKLSTFQIAGAYIGTVIGAGFASGQEIFQFFVLFGKKGLIGLILVTFMFALFGYIIMDIGKKLNSQSHFSIINEISGKYLGSIIDFLVTFFIFCGLVTMFAGSGALFNEFFNLPILTGSIFMAIITAITVFFGIGGVVNGIGVLVPFLILTSVVISILSIGFVPGDLAPIEMPSNSELIKNWTWGSLLYISYNIVLAIAILGPLGANSKSQRSIKNGAILGALGLGISAVCMYFALYTHINDVAGLRVPMIYIAGKINSSLPIIYSVMLLAGIYTTAVASLYGFVANIIDVSNKKKYYSLILLSTLIALIASQFGFSNLVRYLYPAIGYCGLVLLLALLIYKCKKILDGFKIKNLSYRKHN